MSDETNYDDTSGDYGSGVAVAEDTGGDYGNDTAYAEDSGGGNGNGAAYPEISITQIYVQPGVAQSTEEIILGVEAQNAGGAETGPFKARYTIDNGDTQELSWPSMGPGETHYEDWNHAPMQAGSYNFSALLDVENQIQESSKDDNSASMSFTVQDGAMPVDGQDQSADDGSTTDDMSNEQEMPKDSAAGDETSGELAYEGDASASANAEAGGDALGDGETVLASADGEGKGGGGVSVKDLLEIGKFAYSVMKDSQPTSSITGNTASVIPAGATLNEVTGWSGAPHELRLTYISKKKGDPFFRTTIPLVVQWYFNGKYKGHGNYVNRAVVFVDSGADIGSFYNVNITCDLTGAMNQGTDIDPLVKVPILIEVQENDKTTPYQFRKVFAGYLQGDGEGYLEARS